MLLLFLSLVSFEYIFVNFWSNFRIFLFRLLIVWFCFDISVCWLCSFCSCFSIVLFWSCNFFFNFIIFLRCFILRILVFVSFFFCCCKFVWSFLIWFVSFDSLCFIEFFLNVLALFIVIIFIDGFIKKKDKLFYMFVFYNWYIIY